MEKLLKKVDETLSASIMLPTFTLKFTSRDVITSLREINKMLNTIKSMDLSPDAAEFDDPLFFRFINLSDELRSNREIMEFLRSVNRIEENFKQRKVSLENIKILDFGTKSYSTSIDSPNVSRKVSHLLKGIRNCRYAVIHVLGSISREEKQGIVDGVRNQIGNADVKTLFTDKELLGKTVIEGVFFGDFESDELTE